MGAEQSSHETYESYTNDYNDGYRYWADFDKDYFAKGTFRYAFQGTIHGDGPRDGTLCVTKVFKKKFGDHFDKSFRPDHAASVKANRFAEVFTDNVLPSLHKTVHTEKLEFVVPLIASVDSVSHFRVLGLFPVNEDRTYLAPCEYVAIEPFLRGDYQKYNSNGGYENSAAELLNAFSHWTWSISGHKYLVCDLQGVYNGRKYTLTDPCIHSVDRRFGTTDLGVVGMETVLSNHECNAICKQLKLENPLEGSNKVMRRARATTYDFQLDDYDLYRANEARTRYFKLQDAIVE